MATQGIHSLTAGEAACLATGRLGFDEVDFTEHLTEGGHATATYWAATGDLKDSDGDMQLTVTNEQDKDIAALLAPLVGEVYVDLAANAEIIVTSSSRNFTGGGTAWANAAADDDINAFDETTDLTLTADKIGAYCYLPVAEAPMTAGKRYQLGFDMANIVETWTIMDFTGTQTFGTVSLDGTTQVINFTVDADLTGGFRIVSAHATSSGDFDNFTLKELINVGHSFQVTDTADTLANDLATAKGSAVADNDTFVVTGIAEELMPYIIDRTFTGGGTAWADGAGGNAMLSFDETTDLSITANLIADYVVLPVASAPMTVGVKYRLYYDLAGIANTWKLSDFTGTDNHGTISANGTQSYIEFTCTTGGGLRIVALHNDSAGNFDNFSLKPATASVAYVGNLVAAYGWNASKRSTLAQTASQRASAGYNLKGRNDKEYQLTYSVTEGLAPDGDFALTLEGFGGDTELIGDIADREMTGTPNWTNVDIDAYDEAFDITMLDAGDEVITETNARTFAGASSWTNVDYGTTYDETSGGILDLTSSAVGQYCTLPVSIAPMTAGETYRFTYTSTNIAESFAIQDFTGVQTFGTIAANGVASSFDFTVDTGITGGFRIVSLATISDINLDNLSLFHVGQGHYITLAVAKAPMTAGEYYELTFDLSGIAKTWQLQDFTGAQNLGIAISADGTTISRIFKLDTGLTGGLRIVALDPVSAGSFDNFSIKRVDAAGAVVDAVITLPHSSGAQEVFFKSNHNANVADFRVVALCTTATKGALGIDTFVLRRCSDNDYGDGEAWWRINPTEGDCVLAAVSIVGDNLAADITTPTLITVLEADEVIGLFSRITGTSGVIHAYRTAYRE